MSVDANSKDKQAAPPWLSIVGVGADGGDGLTPSARAAIEGAPLVIGSRRQLALVETLLRGETMQWPSPISEGISRLLARRGHPTCVLASGDPFYFGIGATLSPHLTRGEFVCHPAASSLSLAAARLGWPLQELDVVSLHGRELDTLRRHLTPGRHVLALSWDAETPARVAALLTEHGFGSSLLHVLEALGGPDERIRVARADAFALAAIHPLNLVAIEPRAGAGARVLPTRASLPDEAFEHDGQLTKQDVRAITLSALAPRAGALLWDVGAGAGSIAIEWMLSHPACRAIAIERDPERCARIRRNARALGVPALEVHEAVAPAGLDGLARPDAIFVGGGGGSRALFEHCWSALAAGGRLVINAVSLETEALLLSLHASHGGELRRVTVESVVQLGAMKGWRPAMPIMQWRADKP